MTGRRKRDPAQPLQHHVKAWRQSRGLTQQQLAEASGLSRPLITEIESGRTGLSRTSQGAIAAAFGVPPLALFAPPGTLSLDALVSDQPPEVRRQIYAMIEAFLAARSDTNTP